jgi:hypothetical protein
MVTSVEFSSVSTSVFSVGWVTVMTCSRTRVFVAAKRQATLVPAPWPPDSTR